MSPSQDDFAQLRRMLACKRYEQPPPGYFGHFSHRVISRIEVEELREASWWGWLRGKFEARPVLACAYGLAVSTLLLVGFRFSDLLDYSGGAPIPPGSLDLVTLPNQPVFPATFGSVGFSDRSGIVYTTSLSPALRQGALGLDGANGPRVQTVAFGFSR